MFLFTIRFDRPYPLHGVITIEALQNRKVCITVTDQQEKWIQAQMATGNYASDSEVLRELIRKEQQRDDKLEAIRAALIEAEQSPKSDRSPEDIMAAVIERKKRDGTL